MTFDLLWEWTGVITALIYVYLATKGRRSCFIYGLISSVIFIEISFSSQLYFDTSIYGYYVIMSVMGWIQWKSDTGEIEVEELKRGTLVQLLLVSLVVSALLGFLSDSLFELPIAYADAFTTVMAVLATWMMVRRYLENWLIWIVADAAATGLYLYKELYGISLLYLIYTVVAFYGYYNWKKKLQIA